MKGSLQLGAHAARWVTLSLLVGLFALSPATAQESASIDGVLWFDGYENREIVIRENRFILTDHNVQATFRGTYTRVGDDITAVLDPRATVFMSGPSTDEEKLEHIELLVAAGELPRIFSAQPCATFDKQHCKFTIETPDHRSWIRLSGWCGEQRLDWLAFERVR